MISRTVKRKRYWTLIRLLAILLFPVSCLCGNDSVPGADGNCLWISYGELTKNPDGSVTLPLEINYGEISGNKGNILELKNVRVVCSTGRKNAKRNLLCHELPVTVENGTWRTGVSSARTGRFTVMAEARRSEGERTCFYSAKTSFVLFGHSSAKNKNIQPGFQKKAQCPLRISFIPCFNYWPQTGAAISVGLEFTGKPIISCPIRVYDENFPPATVMSGGTKGQCVYVPPNDWKLNRKGKRAFKHLVMVAEYSNGTNKYIASCTRILHRSRFANRRMMPGLTLFCGCLAGFLVIVIGIRRKRRL